MPLTAKDLVRDEPNKIVEEQWVREIEQRYPQPPGTSSFLWTYCGTFRLIYYYSGTGIYLETCDDLLNIGRVVYPDPEMNNWLVRTALYKMVRESCVFARGRGYEFASSLTSMQRAAGILLERDAPISVALDQMTEAAQDISDDAKILALENKMKQVNLGVTSWQAAQQQKISSMVKAMSTSLEFCRHGAYPQFAVTVARMHYNTMGTHPTAFLTQLVRETLNDGR